MDENYQETQKETLIASMLSGKACELANRNYREDWSVLTPYSQELWNSYLE